MKYMHNECVLASVSEAVVMLRFAVQYVAYAVSNAMPRAMACSQFDPAAILAFLTNVLNVWRFIYCNCIIMYIYYVYICILTKRNGAREISSRCISQLLIPTLKIII